MREDKDEAALDRLNDFQDDLEDIVTAAGDRDGEDYLKDLKARPRKIGGRYYLALYWYRVEPPSHSVVYAPFGLLEPPRRC